MFRKPTIWTTILLLVIQTSYAQIGGQRAFEFLHLPYHALSAGLGNQLLTSGQGDVNMLVNNPSLLQGIANGSIAFNYQLFSLSSHLAYVAYADSLRLSGGKWGFGVQHLNHGQFEGYDDAGNPSVDFNAADIALVLAYAHQVQNFSFGTNLKWAYSQMAGLSQSALLLDLSSAFIHPDKDLVVGLAVKNLGFFTSRIQNNNTSGLPFDIQLGISLKPEYMPFRFSITAYRLYEWENVYFEPDMSPDERPGISDQIFRHLIFGGELILSQSVNLRVGYNHLVRRELKIEEAGFLTGFSFGGIIKTKKFNFAYARNIFHQAGGGHTFSISTNMNHFINN